MFQNLSNLKFLFLNHNYLTSVEDWSWSSLPSLTQVDLSDNNLTTLWPNTFKNSFLPSAVDQRFLYLCSKSQHFNINNFCHIIWFTENPWNCDSNLDWLRKWLRTECNIGIDVNATRCYSLCRTPKDLERVPLMGDTPIPVDPSNPSSTDSSFTDLPQNSTMDYQLQVDSATVGYIILGKSWIGLLFFFYKYKVRILFIAVILAVLIISIILLALARYFVSKKHKKDKVEHENKVAQNRSTTNHSVTSSGYPISAFDMDLPRANTMSSRHGTYL